MFHPLLRPRRIGLSRPIRRRDRTFSLGCEALEARSATLLVHRHLSRPDLSGRLRLRRDVAGFAAAQSNGQL